MNSLVSIIIPTYNRVHLLGETLESILAQTYQNWECIVVDDGSVDATEELMECYCKKDERFQFHYRPKNRRKGANACRNYGLLLSKGEYVLFFDSDDIIDKEIFTSAVNYYNQNVEIDFIFCNYCVFEKNIKNIIIEQNNESKNPFLDYFEGCINLATGAIIWKRKTILEAHFDEKLRKTQELDFIFRLYKNSENEFNGFYLNKNAYYLRKHEKSIVGFFKKNQPEFLFSDVYVRNQIMQYFNISEHKEIYVNNRLEMEKSLRYFLDKSNFFEFIKIIPSLKYHGKSIFRLKVELFIFKLAYCLTAREYRYNQAIKKLYKVKFYFNFS